jgi:peptidoglycan/xylan/chitin deacetylase (PgdA/CDA1 family)
MKLVISIDVEEEGLFSGRYARTPPGVTNVAALERLAFIPRDFGWPLTLLVTYQVARNPAACRVLAEWRDLYGAEIGAHLHHWNTPPFADLSDPEPVASEKLPLALLREKFASLVSQIRGGLGVTPRSFRMGRFDAGSQVFGLLPEFGFEVDSSVAPLTCKNPDPRFFLAPADPFVLGGISPEDKPLLEVPITLVPLIAGTPELIDRLAAMAPATWGAHVRNLFRYGCVAGVQPAMYPLMSMQLAAYFHRRRGGRVLTLYFHSSELKPGASPLCPTEAAVNRFVDKIRSFLTWLAQTGPMEGVTLAALGDNWHQPGSAPGSAS